MARSVLCFLAILALLAGAMTAAFIGGGTDQAAFTPEDALTVSVNGVNYTMGRSTPADFAANGWEMAQENDGMFSFLWPQEQSYFYVGTADHQPDSPMTYINLMWADGVTVGYPASTDDSSEFAFWEWLDSEWATDATEYGELMAQLSLPDGRTLQLVTGGNGFSLELTEENR